MPIRALIVDDHEPFRSAARELLEADGFAIVAEAGDGAGALEAARTTRPDLVLLDVYLPDGDGFELAARIVADSSPSPVVVLTSSRDGGDFGPLVGRSGARGFVPKAELSASALKALLE